MKAKWSHIEAVSCTPPIAVVSVHIVRFVLQFLLVIFITSHVRPDTTPVGYTEFHRDAIVAKWGGIRGADRRSRYLSFVGLPTTSGRIPFPRLLQGLIYRTLYIVGNVKSVVHARILPGAKISGQNRERKHSLGYI